MIGITGASGQFGQRVLHHLLDTLAVSPTRVVAATRHPARLSEWTARGVRLRALDFDDAATFGPAFDDVERALLISTDALDRPGRRLEQHRRAIDALAKAGVQHAVYTSMPNPDGSPLLIAPDHAGSEQALAASTLPGFTVLRNHWYFENLAHFMGGALASGTWYAADGGQGSADIGRDDLALAAATVLAGRESGRHTYTLSGRQALTKAQIASRIGAAIGKPIAVVQVPLESLVQGMTGAGLPEPLARVFASFDTNTAAGRVAEVTSDFRRITGRDPQPFDDWLAANKGLFTRTH
jgi:NAD(P)H dehydrogenase (quinone)